MDENEVGTGETDTNGLTLVEFQDWLDSLSEPRHAQTIEALCKLMFSTEHDGETLPQFRLRVKNTVLENWRAADEKSRTGLMGRTAQAHYLG